MRRSIIVGAIVVAGLATAGVAYAENQPPDPSLAVAKACANTPADGSAAANGNGTAAKGLRARIKDRICQRLEQRQQRRAGRAGVGANAGAGQNGGPAVAPSAIVDDGSKTIAS